MYTLRKQIVVDTTLEQAWDFIRNPANLNKITPDDMAFEIVSDLPEEMVEGMRIEYRVKIPVMGKQSWLSELKQIVPHHSFVDVQLEGPYKYWHHFHSIEKVEHGIKLTDHIAYEVPYGIFGKIAHALFIRKTLERIFAHREARFQDLLSC
jgi:ligand-binding SRPBCC domain-containing protein